MLHDGLTDTDKAEAVVEGLAEPQWRRVVSRGLLESPLPWPLWLSDQRKFECAMECGHVAVVTAKEMDNGGSWLVCRECTYSLADERAEAVVEGLARLSRDDEFAFNEGEVHVLAGDDVYVNVEGYALYALSIRATQSGVIWGCRIARDIFWAPIRIEALCYS